MNTANLKFFRKDFLKSKFAIYIAAGGLILFILVSSTFNFRDSIFSKLFPKPYSQAAGPNDWAQVQKDPQRTGFSAETIGPNFKTIWTYPFQPERVHFQVQAIVYSNSVYVGTEMGNMYAIDAATGAKRWSFAAGGAILHSAAADSGKVYFGAMDGAVYAVDTTTGQQVWKTQVSLKGISTAPVLAEGKIMLGGRDGYFFGIDAENGNLIWKYNAGAPVLMTAAYEGGKAYFGSMDMYVHAVNTSDGSQAWKSAKLDGMSMDRYWPVITSGKVIVNTMGAFSASDGNTLGIEPTFPYYNTRSISNDTNWFIANGPLIAAGNFTQVADAMAAQDAIMADYAANPSKYRKATYILDANTGQEAMVAPHIPWQTHNGAANPPCVDRDGKLIVAVPFITSGWGRLDLNFQGGNPTGPRIVDILYDGKNIGGGDFDITKTSYAAGFGNPDENYGLSCSQNLILAMHQNETTSGAGYTGVFDQNTRKWSNIFGSINQQMTVNTQSGAANPASISNGVFYHIVFHGLVARGSGTAPTPVPSSTPTPVPTGTPGLTPTPTSTPLAYGTPYLTPGTGSANCTNTSIGLTPLNDLGTGIYEGKQGGLYSGGSNVRPSVHEAAGLALAQSIVPLDSSGNPDSVNGKYVLLSIGMSNASAEFDVFKIAADADVAKDPHLVIVNGAQGGQVASIFADPNSNPWTVVNDRLTSAGVTPNQVAIAWIKQTDFFSDDTATRNNWITHRDNLAAIARNLKLKFPNIKIAYYSSRIYAGYASTTLNPEAVAYQTGFSVKWLIEGQINNDPILNVNFDPTKGTVTAPWFSWGPYLWADGLTPRSDGLTWACSEFQTDGTHPSATGRDKVANMLLNFFKTDATAKGWFLQ